MLEKIKMTAIVICAEKRHLQLLLNSVMKHNLFHESFDEYPNSYCFKDNISADVFSGL